MLLRQKCTEVCRVTFDDGAQTDDCIRIAGGCQTLRNDRKLETHPVPSTLACHPEKPRIVQESFGSFQQPGYDSSLNREATMATLFPEASSEDASYVNERLIHILRCGSFDPV